MSVQELEAEIAKLPPRELAELAAWLAEYNNDKWDEQIEADLNAGRLDGLLAQAEREYNAGLARPL